jgi:hypothetical protein
MTKLELPDHRPPLCGEHNLVAVRRPGTNKQTMCVGVEVVGVASSSSNRSRRRATLSDGRMATTVDGLRFTLVYECWKRIQNAANYCHNQTCLGGHRTPIDSLRISNENNEIGTNVRFLAIAKTASQDWFESVPLCATGLFTMPGRSSYPDFPALSDVRTRAQARLKSVGGIRTGHKAFNLDIGKLF